jgi:hypothetical protein
MKFKTNFRAIVFDETGYKRALLEVMRKYNELAGAAWIDAAVNRAPIPTWSGASRATFQKLASELGTSVPIGPIVANKDRTSLGQATSSGSGVIEDTKSFYVGFMYKTTLAYLHYNEYNRAIAGPPPQPFSNAVRFTPYNFQKASEKAWRKIAKKAKAPSVVPYIKERKI